MESKSSVQDTAGQTPRSARAEMAAMTKHKLFGEMAGAGSTTDPELQSILDRLIFADIFSPVAGQDNPDEKLREMITIAVLTTLHTSEQLGAHVYAALNIGVSPVEIREVIYQCAPYIGFPRTLNALNMANGVFKQAGISLPMENLATTTDESRLEKGLEVQKAIFGPVIDHMRAASPAELMHIQDHLSAFCFGDIYTRGGLKLQTRELLTLAVLIALGDTAGQITSHIRGNLAVGNSLELCIGVITQCLPYVGFPRTLNALSCLATIRQEHTTN